MKMANTGLKQQECDRLKKKRKRNQQENEDFKKRWSHEDQQKKDCILMFVLPRNQDTDFANAHR